MKIGIIGLGDGGRCNLQGLKMAGAEIVAICDANQEMVSAVRNEHGLLHAYVNFHDLLARPDIELVVVATPDDKHFEPARATLETGKYAFVEKPIATSLEDLRGFEKLAVQYPGRILFSEKYSFAHPVQAALARSADLGKFLCGSTLYTMQNCDRIMGGGKWRTECAYNPCAGGLSHNFMTAVALVGSRIARVRATGQVLTYRENLDRYGGYDTMEGTLEFSNGRRLNWLVCLAAKGTDSPFGHRTVAHIFQFERGSLAYGPTPQSDRLIVDSQQIAFTPESGVESWREYNLGVLYKQMHQDLLISLAAGGQALHDISQGLNVAYACHLAFESAKRDGQWVELPNG